MLNAPHALAHAIVDAARPARGAVRSRVTLGLVYRRPDTSPCTTLRSPWRTPPWTAARPARGAVQTCPERPHASGLSAARTAEDGGRSAAGPMNATSNAPDFSPPSGVSALSPGARPWAGNSLAYGKTTRATLHSIMLRSAAGTRPRSWTPRLRWRTGHQRGDQCTALHPCRARRAAVGGGAVGELEARPERA